MLAGLLEDWSICSDYGKGIKWQAAVELDCDCAGLAV